MLLLICTLVVATAICDELLQPDIKKTTSATIKNLAMFIVSSLNKNAARHQPAALKLQMKTKKQSLVFSISNQYSKFQR